MLVQVLLPGPSVGLSVCPVDCRKMADLIWTVFGEVGQLRPRMTQVNKGGDRPTGRAILGLVGRPTVTNGDSLAQLCESA